MRIIKNLINLFFISFFIFSCSSEKSYDSDQSMVIRLTQDPVRLNPYIYNSSISREVYSYIMLPLIEMDPITYELKPLLINEINQFEEVNEGNGKGLFKLDIEILEDAVWSDGRPVTALDFMFTMKLIYHKGSKLQQYHSFWNPIQRVDIDPNNPKNFSVISSDGGFFTLITVLTSEIYPAHLYDPSSILSSVTLDQLKDTTVFNSIALENEPLKNWGDGFHEAKYSREVVEGAGPYKLDTWMTDQFIKLVRKPNYWGKAYPDRWGLQAYPKELIFQIIKEDVNAIAQVRSGELDICRFQSITAEKFEELEDDQAVDENYDFFTPQLLRYFQIAINNESPFLNDKLIRRALVHAIDVDKMIENIENGYSKRVVSVVNPIRSYYNKNLMPLEFNPEKSKELLAQAGWTDTNNNGIVDKVMDGNLTEMKLRYFSSSSPLSQRLALMIKDFLADVGVEMEFVMQASRVTRTQNIAPGDFELTAQMISQSVLGDSFEPYWHSKNIGATNQARFKNDRVDEILTELTSDINDERERALYYEFQQIMHNEQPVILLYFRSDKIAVKEDYEPVITLKRPGYMANSFKFRE